MQDLLVKSRKHSWKRNFKNMPQQFISERAEVIIELLKYAKEGNQFPKYNLSIKVI